MQTNEELRREKLTNVFIELSTEQTAYISGYEILSEIQDENTEFIDFVLSLNDVQVMFILNKILKYLIESEVYDVINSEMLQLKYIFDIHGKDKAFSKYKSR